MVYVWNSERSKVYISFQNTPGLSENFMLTTRIERWLALKFLLHLVGDVHQPLHAADDHDAGGNRKQVAASGFQPGNLHHFWDVEFVERIGTDPAEVAAHLIASISGEQGRAWSHGAAADWATSLREKLIKLRSARRLSATAAM